MSEVDRLRVLAVSAWDPRSGAMTVMRSLSERLGPDGVSYDAFAFDGWGPDTLWSDFCDDLIDGRRETLSELLMRRKYDVVHLMDTAVEPPYGTDVWLHRARYRGGVLLMSQNSDPVLRGQPRADVYVACSPSSAEVMRQTVSSPIRVVLNGVDDRIFRVLPSGDITVPDRPILLWVGRATDRKQKDVEGFLRIAASLLDSDIDFWLVDSDGDGDILRLTDWFGHRVRYIPKATRAEIAVVYNQVARSGGALVNTSTFEGLPLTALEAAMCDCPLIAPRVPGFDHAADGVNALLYERTDAIARVRELVAAVREPRGRARVVANARSWVSAHATVDTMAAGYLQAYRDAVATAEKRGRDAAGDRLAREAWRHILPLRPPLTRFRRSIGR